MTQEQLGGMILPLAKPLIAREWAMPSADTFSIPPIAAFIERWKVDGSTIDPFARNSTIADITNDLNPDTAAMYHMEAAEFARDQWNMGVRVGRVLFDPPYSPRQISEVYASIGRPATTEDTQNARLYKAVRDALDCLLVPGGIALSFGWNSAGFGKKRGYEIEEILMVAHGGAHNDTICVAERKLKGLLI